MKRTSLCINSSGKGESRILLIYRPLLPSSFITSLATCLAGLIQARFETANCVCFPLGKFHYRSADRGERTHTGTHPGPLSPAEVRTSQPAESRPAPRRCCCFTKHRLPASDAVVDANCAAVLQKHTISPQPITKATWNMDQFHSCWINRHLTQGGCFITETIYEHLGICCRKNLTFKLHLIHWLCYDSLWTHM